MATTSTDELIVTVQEPVPLHPPPLHPVKVELAPGVASSVTTVPGVKVSVQSAPQLIPVPVTVPVPAPDFVIVSVYGNSANCASTAVVASTVTVQPPVPLQPPPLQPTKIEAAPGVASSVTT
ncbi:MAG TPA: hypothetical protein VLT61_04535, partial [Anaeromyxobacteraceae bacterium]|nr:hypothetical protein [Anaeromyxobacteraceae bacterium]